MKYECHEANTYIFKQGGKSNKSYGIISGHISIRSKKMFRKNKIVSKTIDKEKKVFGPGMCLGEWEIIYNIPRSASAFALTKVELFNLDKEVFEKSLAKEIIRSDQKEKVFVDDRIPFLSNIKQYQNILSQIIPLV